VFDTRYYFYKVESRYFSANINRIILFFLLIGLMVFSAVTLTKCSTLCNLLGNAHRLILAMFSSRGSTATRVAVFFRSVIDFRFKILSILFVVIRDCADDLQQKVTHWILVESLEIGYLPSKRERERESN
jgi:hypothetical protein